MGVCVQNFFWQEQSCCDNCNVFSASVHILFFLFVVIFVSLVSLNFFLLFVSDVKSSRPDCPRGRNFVLGLDLGLDKLSSASSSSSGIWPRHVLRLRNLASSICVFHDKAQANNLHSTIRPMPSQYKLTIYSHLTCLDHSWQNVCRDD